MDDVSEDEAISAIRHMKAKTALGPDGLLAPLIKNLLYKPTNPDDAPPIATALASLWTRCIRERRIPHAWRKSHITLLPKNERGLAGDPSAMRPIAVASILYRGLM